MTNEIQTTDKPRTLEGILQSPRAGEQFAKALPEHLTPDRFVRVALTCVRKNPKLKECTQESVFNALLNLSAMGLEPDGRRAHLIPYGRECTLIVDYKGLVELVRRSGDVAEIHTDVVCAGDIFEHNKGRIERHTFDLQEKRGEPYAAYAEVTFKGGGEQAVIMSFDEIEAIRKASRGANQSPWRDHLERNGEEDGFPPAVQVAHTLARGSGSRCIARP